MKLLCSHRINSIDKLIKYFTLFEKEVKKLNLGEIRSETANLFRSSDKISTFEVKFTKFKPKISDSELEVRT